MNIRRPLFKVHDHRLPVPDQRIRIDADLFQLFAECLTVFRSGNNGKRIAVHKTIQKITDCISRERCSIGTVKLNEMFE